MRLPLSSSPSREAIMKKYMPGLDPFINIYKNLHQNPELGGQEAQTAKIIADCLQEYGYKQVETGIGGYGICGVCKNGSGQTVLLRADMDALPVLEDTGLDYASKVTQVDKAGRRVPIMHACGHDMHVAWLLAIAKLMMDAKKHWSGTLICLFQPNEESGEGAQAMVDDGLYERIPVPDVILGQHVDFERAGQLAITSGVFMAAANSFVVVIIGRGGHGSQPQFCVDPIVIAGQVIVRLQSIVSRIVAPLDTAVVTCGSIHGGEGENVIPDRVELKLNVRTYNEKTRDRVLTALHEIIKSECKSAGAPQEPIIKQTTSFPLTENDKETTDAIFDVFRQFFGPSKTQVQEKLAGSEDISNLARPNNTPYAYWFLGGTNECTYDDAVNKGQVERIPRNHSPKFAPVVESTLTIGIQALALAALHYLA